MVTRDVKRMLSPPPLNWPRRCCLRLCFLLLPWALSINPAAALSAPHQYKNVAAPATITSKIPKGTTMYITIGTRRFAVKLADNSASRAFVAQLPLTLAMDDLNANEKHAQLPKALPADPTRPGKIRSGDLMLYGSATLVVFYKSFDSRYEYTRLGGVSAPEDLAATLGAGEVQVTFALE